MDNSCNLPEQVRKNIEALAGKNSIEKVILFGSRARKTNNERSDVDIAVAGGDFDSFYWDINDNMWTLLSFDIVKLDKCSDELKKEIDRDGIIIYEKDR